MVGASRMSEEKLSRRELREKELKEINQSDEKNNINQEDSKQKSARICPYCGTKNLTSSKFCKECGKSVNGTNEQYEIQKQTKYCENCGKKIDKKAEICPKCGVRVMKPQINRNLSGPKNAGTAAVLSIFIIGTGQMYNGEFGKGFLFFIVALITGSFWITGVMYPLFFVGPLFSIALIVWICVWIYALIDAYRTAEHINYQLDHYSN